MHSIPLRFWIASMIVILLVLFIMALTYLAESVPIKELIFPSVFGALVGVAIWTVVPKKMKLANLRCISGSASKKEIETMRRHTYLGIAAGFAIRYATRFIAPQASPTTLIVFAGFVLVSLVAYNIIFVVQNIGEIK